MLALRAGDLRREAAKLAHGVGIPAASAAVATYVGQSLVCGPEGRRVGLGLALTAGGMAAAWKGKGRIVPYAGVGLAVGSLLGLFVR